MKPVSVSSITSEVRRWHRAGAWLGALLVLVGCNGLFYYPSRATFTDPETIGLRYIGVFFDSGDGTRLHGWFFPAQSDGASKSVTTRAATVVHFHGNAENISTHFRGAEWLARAGYNVLVFDYRGYGSSDGVPSRAGIQLDAAAAIAYVRARPDVDSERLVLFGQSLGAAIAVAAVAEPGNRPGVRAVILESGFASYRRIAREKLAAMWFTWPLQWPLSFLVSDALRPVDLVPAVAPIPVLIVHGTLDPIVPFEHADALYAAAREPKALWAVTGGGHINAFGRYGVVYRPALLEYLRQHLEGP